MRKTLIGRVLTSLATVLLALGLSAPAFAVCPAANQFNLNFATQTAAALTYASTPTYVATSTALGNQNVTFSWTTNGINAGTGLVYPRVAANVNGANGGNALTVGGTFAARTASITAATNVVVTTIGFATPIRDASITLSDVDFSANSWRDWVHIVGISVAGNYVPVIVTPHSTANGGVLSNLPTSSLTLGPTGVGVVPAATIQQAVGLGGAADTTNTGNLTMSFAQPVTSVQVRYGNYPFTTGENTTGNQHMSFLAVSYCPMPSLTVLKSSTPVVTALTDPNRFNIPLADTYYSITVSNSNSSPVDANSIILNDLLPSQMTFFNGDMDGAGPLTNNFEFIPGTSGLTLGAANITYLDAGNVVIPSPAAGYTAAVKTLRWAPQGTMAPNSSFTFRFRTQIK